MEVLLIALVVPVLLGLAIALVGGSACYCDEPENCYYRAHGIACRPDL